jgi:hypothetical protein
MLKLNQKPLFSGLWHLVLNYQRSLAHHELTQIADVIRRKRYAKKLLKKNLRATMSQKLERANSPFLHPLALNLSIYKSIHLQEVLLEVSMGMI